MNVTVLFLLKFPRFRWKKVTLSSMYVFAAMQHHKFSISILTFNTYTSYFRHCPVPAKIFDVGQTVKAGTSAFGVLDGKPAVLIGVANT